MNLKSALLILIIDLIYSNCKNSISTNNCTNHRIEFVNHSGFIKLNVNSFFNDSYLTFQSACVSSNWTHVITNKKYPKLRLRFVNTGYSDSVCYLFISYPCYNFPNYKLEILDSMAVNKENKLHLNGNKESILQIFGKNKFMISKENIGIKDSSKACYQSITARNNISITLEANIYNVIEFQKLFKSIVESVEYKFNCCKLIAVPSNLDSFLIEYNNSNKF
ncbi:MAG: hypothetical protein ABIO44_14270 [Saprospiraceae bacterium]